MIQEMIQNPILTKELFIKLRYSHVPLPQRIGAGLAIFILLAFSYFQVITSLQRSHDSSDGNSLWMLTMGLQAAFIVLITPVAATNAITKEREQRTWEMLVFTRLTAKEIILGKLAGRMVSTFMVFLLGLPISVISFFYANLAGPNTVNYISPLRFCITYLGQIILALCFTTLGLYLSLMLKRTLYAVMSAYTIVIGGLVVATTFITSVLSIVAGGDFYQKSPLMWINPVMIITELLNSYVYSNGAAGGGSVADSLQGTYLTYGLVVYLLVTVFMIWRMIAGFRKFAYES